ncbi:S-adenosylmethionine-dependent methyltransferase [Ferrimonas sediminum]|uniref:tRNA 5-carboxymethoxyuridine methyltransferase n=1 Tax=Ferrimonas sediminum TaxID=718193 RepID=A0A1G8UJ64_9GAMM|nr:methyltransferase [Ferrimonas sediminum]SDJ53916.1 S-adenosylmethionine-dependent methyltransferase [Ferrimonas sediminum]
MADVNFDTRASKFARNIYDSSKGKIREAVLMRELTQHILPQLPDACPVLDAGGGQGQLSLQLAQRGHSILLCDLSREMLLQAQSRAQALGVTDRLITHHSPLQELGSREGGPYPLVLCHAVMEWLEQPQQTLMGLLEQVAPGGYLSLMFFNYRGMEMHNLVAGNFDNLGHTMVHGKKKVKLAPKHGFDNQQVIQWLTEAGMVLERQVGVRVIHDYLRDKGRQEQSLPRLLELELEYSEKPVFCDLGRYTHLTLRKPV